MGLVLLVGEVLVDCESPVAPLSLEPPALVGQADSFVVG